MKNFTKLPFIIFAIVIGVSALAIVTTSERFTNHQEDLTISTPKKRDKKKGQKIETDTISDILKKTKDYYTNIGDCQGIIDVSLVVNHSVIEQRTNRFVSKGGVYHSKTEEIEVLNSENYMVTINHPEKEIYIDAPISANFLEQGVIGLDQWSNLVVSGKLEFVSESLARIRFELTEDGSSSIEYLIDTASGRLIQMDIKDTDFLNPQDLDKTQYNRLYKFTEFKKLESSSLNRLVESNYISVSNGIILPSNSLTGYSIVDNLPLTD